MSPASSPARVLLCALTLASLTAATPARADPAPVWSKDARGRIADALRIDISATSCPTLTYRLGSADGRKVLAAYAPIDYGCALPAGAAARKSLPAQLHTLLPPGDVSFVELYVQEERPAGAAAVKVLRAPEVWVEPPVGSRVEPQEQMLADAILAQDIEHVCLTLPTPKRECQHQPQVLAALKAYLAALDRLYEAVPDKLPDVRYFGPGPSLDTSQVWFEPYVLTEGFKSPYAVPTGLEAGLDLENNLRRFKPGSETDVEHIDLATVERVMQPELAAARAAWATYQARLGGKTPYIRLRNAAGTESRATRGVGC